MKKILVLLLFVIFTDCNQIIDLGTGIFFGVNLYDFGFEIDDPYEIGWKIYDLGIVFKYDVIYDWSDPKDTVERGYGDCNDFAVLFLNLYYYGTGKKGEIVLTDMNTRSIDEGGIPNHVIVRIDGKLFDPQQIKFVDYPVQYYYTFDQVFN